MANFTSDNPSIDCAVAALALASGDVRLARHLLSRAALLLRIRGTEPTLSIPDRFAYDC